MINKSEVEKALESSWHRQTAEASLERWIQLCEQQKWGQIPENLSQLIAVFGVSWYFTRFIFYRGKEAAEFFDIPALESFDEEILIDFLSVVLQEDDQEIQFEYLRRLKNQTMLQILIRRLSLKDSLEDSEAALSRLAAATLTVAMRIVGIELEHPDCQVAVLGMGRIAGLEMNFGSDLDLIFLYKSSTEEFYTSFSEKVRKLLRNMSILTPTGVLYDIDMRLRPHGTSGALITSVKSFLEYHQSKRESWERQVMTRCCPIIDKQGLGRESLSQLTSFIYSDEKHEKLNTEILNVRQRVEDEIGNRRGKIDVKRGRGGIMDIDFTTHYLQLKNGHKNPELQTTSTREALRALSKFNLLEPDDACAMRESYDYYKKVEACLRLFDLKSVSNFSRPVDNENPLVRAMSEGEGFGPADFINKYEAFNNTTRRIYLKMLAIS